MVCFREGYTREALTRDVIAGLVVGIVALPLALAFAIASGVQPERGLYTAIIAGFIISAFGGSRVQIGGPTGAFVVIVYGIVTKYGYEGLVLSTMLAGVILIVMGLARMGALIKFIPYPVITGFTSGIAVIIFSSQVKDFLGLKMGAVPPDFVAKWTAFAEHIGTINWTAGGVAVGTLIVLIVWPKISRMVPAPFVAMILATLAVQIFALPVETIGSRFGAVPSSLRAPHLPNIPWQNMRELISPSITIALLAAIESLLSAVVADGMIGTRHKSNMELVAQGVANIASPVFGGIPATGAIARTATNIRSGGRTPLAGMVHALTLMLILVFAGQWAAKVPLAALAAILVLVAYHMSEWRSFAGLLRAPKSDVFVLVVTFALTLFVDLTVAVQVGVVAASLLFMRRMAEVTNIEGVSGELSDTSAIDDPESITQVRKRKRTLSGRVIPKDVEIYEVNGPFFFGAADKIREVVSEIEKPPRVLILRMRNVPAIDATGIHALGQLALKCKSQSTLLILSEVREQPRSALARSKNVELFANRVTTLDDALDRAAAVESTANGLPS
ncbi:MAG: sulfate permease [Acidobacteria bacterium]|nr:sulfate permease [Acidobacteriota bacterium]MBV9071746.1 sulfate permease [Acidobacteriota bacterium]MBV9187068.1 sulfate permease [Acidobacteriota bacterium]